MVQYKLIVLGIVVILIAAFALKAQAMFFLVFMSCLIFYCLVAFNRYMDIKQWNGGTCINTGTKWVEEAVQDMYVARRYYAQKPGGRRHIIQLRSLPLTHESRIPRWWNPLDRL